MLLQLGVVKITWVIKVLSTFGDDAFQTDQVSEGAGGQGSRAHVSGAEASLEAHVELFKLLAKGGVDGGHQVLQGPLERDEFTKRVVQQTGIQSNQHRDAVNISTQILLAFY